MEFGSIILIVIYLVLWPICWFRMRRKMGGSNSTYDFVYQSSPQKVFPDVICLFCLCQFYIVMSFISPFTNDMVWAIKTAGSISVLLILIILFYGKKRVNKLKVLIITGLSKSSRGKRTVLGNAIPVKVVPPSMAPYETIKNTKEVILTTLILSSRLYLVVVLLYYFVTKILIEKINLEIIKDFLPSTTVYSKSICSCMVILFCFSMAHIIWVFTDASGTNKPKGIRNRFLHSETDN